MDIRPEDAYCRGTVEGAINIPMQEVDNRRAVSYTHLDVYKRQIMCLENKMPMLVFGLNEPNSIVETMSGTFTCLLYTSRCV